MKLKDAVIIGISLLVMGIVLSIGTEIERMIALVPETVLVIPVPILAVSEVGISGLILPHRVVRAIDDY